MPLDLTWSRREAEAYLRAMKSVATFNGRLNLEPIDVELLEATQEHVLGHRFDIGALEPIAPEAVLDAIDEPHEREQLLQFAVLMPYAPGEVDPRRVSVVEAFAEAMELEPQTLEDLRAVRDENLITLRLDYVRRQINDIVQADSTVERMLKVAGHWIDRFGDKDLAERYVALGDLPQGSLGQVFYQHYRDRGFPLPGEKDSMTELLVPHDLCHVLGGFNTDMKGEISVAGFEAAMSRTEAGYDVLLSVLLNFHLGIKFTYDASHGHLDPDDLMEGFARGAPVEVDLLTDWDWWPHVERDLVELREELGIVGAEHVQIPVPTAP